MTKSAPANPPNNFVDDPHATEIFASAAVGFMVGSGTIHVTFVSTRVNHETYPGPINRVVNLRLVMSTLGAQEMAVELYDFLKANGLDPAPRPASSKMQ